MGIDRCTETQPHPPHRAQYGPFGVKDCPGVVEPTPPAAAVATHASGLGKDWPVVAGRCPACSGAGLFLGGGGHVTCSRVDCRAPDAADDLLHGGPWRVYPLRRREWAAALEHGSDELAEQYPVAAARLRRLANRTRNGVHTPWVDQPTGGPDVAAAELDLPCTVDGCGRERPCPVHDHPAPTEASLRQCPRRWGDWDDLPSSIARCPDCGWGRPAHPTAAQARERAADADRDDCLRTGADVRARGEADGCGWCGYPAWTHPGDAPEPSAAPAQPAQGAPAAADPHPGTPDTPAGAELDLDLIEARTDAVPDGPWREGSTGPENGDHWFVAAEGHAVAHIHSDDGQNERSRRPIAKFIAHARTDVPALVAEVRRLRSALTNARAVASDRLASADKITKDIMAERDAALAGLHRLRDGGAPAPPASPDTPAGGGGVLGRALLDAHNQVWLLVDEADAWRCGTLTPRSRAEVERYWEVREVLLVSPAAGRVLDAARRVGSSSLSDALDWRRIAANFRELRAALAALDGDNPAESAPDERLNAIARQLAASVHAEPGTGPRLSEVQAAARAAGGRLVVDVEPEPAPEHTAGTVLITDDGRCGCCAGTGEHRCGHECDSCDGSGGRPDDDEPEPDGGESDG